MTLIISHRQSFIRYYPIFSDPYCRHPGRPSHGDSTAPAKDYYLVGEKIVFYCPSPEYKLNSENVLSCIGAGKWSRKVPLCLLANRN
uniref:Sushi domain-containing protein n=1 Tax=Heterorhabditis bacteriophora TaxID=37862 RepID=A0A1I7X476_HETBA